MADSAYKCKTPVIMIIFNRADTANAVFEHVRKVQPPKLLLIGDGARQNKQGELEKVLKTREIAQKVDWNCEVLTNFSDENLGCKKRISSGLDWAFSIVDRAIILEDDCKPAETFFRFCDEMLERYKDDERIMMVSGDEQSGSKEQIAESYYFTKHVHIWGWATWARAWQKNDTAMKDWPEINRKKSLAHLFKHHRYNFYWCHYFGVLYENRVNSWAGPWVYSVWKESGLSIAPKTNLITNIGFGKDATHTSGKSIYAEMQTQELEFPLVHPKYVLADARRDELEMKHRCKDDGRLPYPFDVLASLLKWFIIRRILKR